MSGGRFAIKSLAISAISCGSPISGKLFIVYDCNACNVSGVITSTGAVETVGTAEVGVRGVVGIVEMISLETTTFIALPGFIRMGRFENMKNSNVS